MKKKKNDLLLKFFIILMKENDFLLKFFIILNFYEKK